MEGPAHRMFFCPSVRGLFLSRKLGLAEVGTIYLKFFLSNLKAR